MQVRALARLCGLVAAYYVPPVCVREKERVWEGRSEQRQVCTRVGGESVRTREKERERERQSVRARACPCCVCV